MNYVGTAGNDTISGTNLSDTFDMTAGGLDAVFGRADDDLFYFGATLSLTDTVSGGRDYDTIDVDGDYTAGLSLGSNLFSVERIFLEPTGAGYNLTLGPNTYRWKNFDIDGQLLTSANTLNVDLTNAGSGHFFISAGDANASVTGGTGKITVSTTSHGVVDFTGGSNKDTFTWESTGFDVNSIWNGGGGKDTLYLNGDLSAGVVFKGTTMAGMEKIILMHGFSYDLTLKDANIAPGAHLTVDGLGISGAGTFFHFDAHNETDGDITVLGGGLNGIYATGSGNDVLQAGFASVTNIFRPGAGHDQVIGSSSQDIIKMEGFLDRYDRIDGGTGTQDELDLKGDYSPGLHFRADTMRNIDRVHFAAAYDYVLSLVDANLAAGKTLLFDATALGRHNHLDINGSAELDGLFDFRGGQGRDRFHGGAGDDDFHGSGGADTFFLGSGSNDLFFDAATDSTGRNFDRVLQFDGSRDWIGLPFSGGGGTPLDSGSLSKASFDSDLSSQLGSLSVHGGIAFTPDAGDMAGRHFLILDFNGTAGYQIGSDLVIEFVSPQHWGTFNFFTGG